MDLVNFYDFTFTGNYLTSNDYVCFLEQPRVRKALHLGNIQFQFGDLSNEKMQAGVMREGIARKIKLFIHNFTSEKFRWFEQLLSKTNVLIYSGNLDVIVNFLGITKMV